MPTSLTTVPALFDRALARTVYDPRLQESYEAGVALRGAVAPAATDKQRVLLWLVDPQIDFVMPAPVGNLPVPGAVDDTLRTLDFLYANLGQITAVAASMDTHRPFQIFHQPWWKNAQGQNPPAWTVITYDDAVRGVWQPVLEPKESIQYLQELESVAKKQLMIWPFHCLEGSTGRAIVPALFEGITIHSAARYAQPTWIVKGDVPDTEFYSVVEPEVKRPNHPNGGLNVAFLTMLSAYSLIYVAGQARSHCVLETMASVMRYFATSPEVIAKFRFLDDCTSSIPGFEQATDAAYKTFARQGLRIVQSTDPIG